MFQNRKSSQKPGEEFIANFRQNYSGIATAITSAGNNHTDLAAPAGGPERHHSLGDVLNEHQIRDSDPTPRAQNDTFRFTPLDSNFTFNQYANQSPGGQQLYAATPGGTHTLNHYQAGDLHTPFVLGTPFSMHNPTDTLHPQSMMGMSHFNQQIPHSFANFDNPFPHANLPQHTQPLHQTAFAPSSFLHQDTGYETMDHDGSPMEDDEGPLGSMERAMQMPNFPPQSYDTSIPGPGSQHAEKFRFHVVLAAPTAMIKTADEIPLTYLNKGQAYTVTIKDTLLNGQPPQPGTRYRTFVRISFEDEQQRLRPGHCWQLWKEGRGMNEAHQRGGKLQAVEYVDIPQPGESDEKQTRVELDSASFDGFSVIWTPGINCIAKCDVAVRFNFLSTDFSHSKGVKGIPLRFCAKTQTLPGGSPHISEASEVAFCKVKLFRDHGAERKLTNDNTHVQKNIDKIKQQIAQAETGLKDFGKRKRGTTTKAQMSEQRPGKVQKHKRTWSMSSASSAGGRAPTEENLEMRLQSWKAMFSSTRPVSVLHLRGTEQDDPDASPVVLPRDSHDLTRMDPHANPMWPARSDALSTTTRASSIISPSPSSNSLRSQAGVTTSNASASWNDYQNLPSGDFQNQNPQHLASPPDQLTKVPKSDDAGSLSGWIEALGVDPAYNPPIIEPPVKPVACFYILRRDPAQPAKRDYHRAIYLMQRTIKDFTNAIALKWSIEPTKIMRTIRVLENGLQVEMDDDVIQAISEGQDFILEVHNSQIPLKSEWEDEMDVSLDNDSASPTQNLAQSEGYELRLIF